MENEICKDKEKDPEVIKRRTHLFNIYVMPYLNMIYKLCMNYSWHPNNVEENYTQVLANFYRRIETYNPERSIHTWLHIVTKRQVMALERKRSAMFGRINDDDVDTFYSLEIHDAGPDYKSLTVENYREFYDDDILDALDSLNPIHRDALLLQEAGYTLKEIVDIEYKKGTLKTRNIATIKSRLFLARQYLKKYLTHDGERIPD